MLPQKIGPKVHQRRAHKRYDYASPCAVIVGEHEIPAVVRNISAGGICLRLDANVSISTGNTVLLSLDGIESVGMVVRWSQDAIYGFQFLKSLASLPKLAELIGELEADPSVRSD